MVHHQPQDNLPGLPEELKPHRCDVCGQPILAGQTILRGVTQYGLFGPESQPFTHVACHRAAIKEIP